jgi:hypothetical protein
VTAQEEKKKSDPAMIERLRKKMDAALSYRHGQREPLEVRDVKAPSVVRQDAAIARRLG